MKPVAFALHFVASAAAAQSPPPGTVCCAVVHSERILTNPGPPEVYHYTYQKQFRFFTAPTDFLHRFSLWFNYDLFMGFFANHTFIHILDAANTDLWTTKFGISSGPLTLYDFFPNLVLTPGSIYEILLEAGDPHAPGFINEGIDGTGIEVLNDNSVPGTYLGPVLETEFLTTPEPTPALLAGSGLAALLLTGLARARDGRRGSLPTPSASA